MLNVTIEAENSKLKVCYSSDIGKTTVVPRTLTNGTHLRELCYGIFATYKITLKLKET